MVEDVSVDKSEAENSENHSFQAEVAKLLHLMVHSVYSDRDVFLRELISNASDACDKLRYKSVADPSVLDGAAAFQIQLRLDKDNGLLFVKDNGLGMSHDELIDNLGTIAKSGTSDFVKALSKEGGGASQLIGQFGVGFYSAFMVADKVRVISRKVGEDQAWAWESDGMGAFSVAPVDDTAGLVDGRGTSICLTLKDDAKNYLEPFELKRIVKEYSDHIAFPIYLFSGEDGAEPEQVNSSGALWTRPKSDIDEETYKEFYHHVGQVFDDPALTIHYKAEGRHEYTVLLFVPKIRPMDLFDPKRSVRVKLYVKRVYITDDAELLPGYLRFVRGVIDSEDMPLNLSREMLQHNPLVANIRGAVTKRILTELQKLKDKDAEAFLAFWETFGAVVKEGLYEDFERREQILDLALFRSSAGEDWRSLSDYVDHMKDNQTAIYYLRGDDADTVRLSPQLEGYRARGVEVLLLTDPIDGFWTSGVSDYKGKPFKSVAHGDTDLSQFEKKAETDKTDEGDDAAIGTPEAKDLGTLIAAFKQALEGKVADVRVSGRLVESPVCLVADSQSIDPYMERIMAQSMPGGGGGDVLRSRILEINGDHPLIAKLSTAVTASGVTPEIEDAAAVLLDQARLLEGEAVIDPSAFSKRLVGLLNKTFD